MYLLAFLGSEGLGISGSLTIKYKASLPSTSVFLHGRDTDV
jgi:hypothetical protein